MAEVARDALTQALTSQNAFSTAAAAWHVRNSNYDDDLGLLSAWLGQLRRTGDAGKEAAASLLIALNGEQASYLVALFTHPDRSLRLAAKETTGWLLQGRTHSRSLPLEKLLDPLRSLLSGSMHTSFVRQKTNNSPPPLRNYVVYDVVDALHKPWCGFPANQRQKTLTAFETLVAAEVGPRASDKIETMKATCP